MTLKDKLNSIRILIDADVSGVDIDNLVEKGKQLSQMMGLSAECKAEARKDLENARLAAIIQIENKKYPPSVMLKIAEAMCADELEIFEYSDRLNAGITHQLDYYRTVISLHKTELENSLKL
jgi:DNA-binding XRE family transcriptional regulator